LPHPVTLSLYALITSFQIHNNNNYNNNNLSSQDIEKENTKNNNEITIFIQQTTERQGAQENVGFFMAVFRLF